MKRYIKSAITPIEDIPINEQRDYTKDPDAHPEMLRRLSLSDEPWIRQGVADNPNTPVDVLVELSFDAEYTVRVSAAMNPNLPVSDIVRLASDSNESVKVGVARNPNTPADILEALSTFVGRIDDYLVRYWVAMNHNTPLTALKQLRNDHREPVRKAAQKTISEVYGNEALY